jgi:hypothetical protein
MSNAHNSVKYSRKVLNFAGQDKPVSKFRDYTIDPSDPLKERVRRTYHEMHKNQTVDFVKAKVRGINRSLALINVGVCITTSKISNT